MKKIGFVTISGGPMTLTKGDAIEVTWPDGLVISGIYVGTERGYIIVRTSDGERTACGPSVTFKKVI